MYVFNTVNHTKWGIRFKLLSLGLLIYIVWDVNQGLFDFVFQWLGTDSIIGAKSGSKAREGGAGPLYLCSVVMLGLTVWWLTCVYSKGKFEYNLVHSYFAIIPLTSYIFFRNVSLPLRSHISTSLHDLGKTTLETYLLQHHIWLTSNAKTLLTWVPDHPYLNFALATMVFFIVAKELYRLTMSLRGLIIPDDHSLALRNMAGLIFALALCYVTAYILTGLQLQGAPEAYGGSGSSGVSGSSLLAACSVLALLVVQLLSHRGNPTLKATHAFSSNVTKARCVYVFICVCVCVCVCIHVSHSLTLSLSHSPTLPLSHSLTLFLSLWLTLNPHLSSSTIATSVACVLLFVAALALMSASGAG
eukprot:GSChrysophyteH2.ASY1.ANO1.1490.1 assembled CDS